MQQKTSSFLVRLNLILIKSTRTYLAVNNDRVQGAKQHFGYGKKMFDFDGQLFF